jgi:bacillithiol biosynthesis deacetylase BshB1
MTVEVLAIGAHPDDVELGCGGTLAVLAAAGVRTGIIHLTRGEAGTRGSGAERQREAEVAAQILGVAELRFLDCGDGALRTGTAEEDALIELLRELLPEVILGPTQADRHPDHGRAHRLVADAAFYAGLRGRAGASAESPRPVHRPGAVYSYMQHNEFRPSFVVDVTAGWTTKLAALDAYPSQIHRPGVLDPRSEPLTKTASVDFRAAIEGRARHYGNLAGATFGEPFWAPGPLAVSRAELLLELVAGGVR